MLDDTSKPLFKKLLIFESCHPMNTKAQPLKLPRYHHCFVCGDQNPIGLDVTFQMNGGRVETRFIPQPGQHTGYQTIVHGGILATLLDECMGWSGFLSRPVLCLTAELNIRYRESANAGKPLLIYGELVHDRKRMIQARGAIEKEDGTVVCSAEGKYIPLSEAQQNEVIAYAGWDKKWPELVKQLQTVMVD